MTVPTRIALRTAVLALVASAVLLAAPVTAETYLITLQNGTTIQSRYQPQESSWDAGMVLFMTETGNWIGLKKADIVNVEQENNLRGFGFVINPTTVALGWAPNDAADPAAAVEGDFAARLLQALSGPPPPPKENYTVQQGVSTEQTQGIPLDYVGQAYGGNQQQAPPPPSVVILPQATPGPATPATASPNSDSTPPQ